MLVRIFYPNFAFDGEGSTVVGGKFGQRARRRTPSVGVLCIHALRIHVLTVIPKAMPAFLDIMCEFWKAETESVVAFTRSKRFKTVKNLFLKKRDSTAIKLPISVPLSFISASTFETTRRGRRNRKKEVLIAESNPLLSIAKAGKQQKLLRRGISPTFESI